MAESRFTLTEFDDLLNDLEGNIQQMKDDSSSSSSSSSSDTDIEKEINTLDEEFEKFGLEESSNSDSSGIDLGQEIEIIEEEVVENPIEETTYSALPDPVRMSSSSSVSDASSSSEEIISESPVRFQSPPRARSPERKSSPPPHDLYSQSRLKKVSTPPKRTSPPRSHSQHSQHGLRGFSESPAVNFRFSGPRSISMGSTASYHIMSTDAAGRPSSIDSSMIEAVAEGPDRVSGVFRELELGKGSIEFRLSSMGSYNIVVRVNGKVLFRQSLSVGGREDFSQTSGQDYHFSARGPGLAGAKVGETTYFELTVTLNNRPTNVRTTDLVVELTGPDRLYGAVIPQQEGTYRVEYCPHEAGTYTLNIRWNNKSIFASPPRITVAGGTRASNCVVLNKPSSVRANQKSTFTVQARDAQGRNVGVGGEVFEVSCSGPGRPQGLTIRDMGNGSYTVEFVFPSRGTYNFFVKHHGQDITGSPVTVNCN